VSNATPEELEDDGLARALGRFERQRDEDRLEALIDERPEWEAVARGELDVDEAIARRRAAGDADVDRAADYFRPFAANETAALVDGLLESVGSQAPDAAPDNVVPFVPRPSTPAPAPAKPHDPGSSRFWWIPGGMLATAAAAIVLWWVWPPSEDVLEINEDGGTVIATRDPSLPGYVLETDGGLKSLRGETEGETSPDDARHRYQRDTSFEWVLRPKADVEDAVAVRGFAFADGGRAGLPLQLDALAKVAPTGAIRIAGKIAELNLEPGRYTIALAVGRPEALPTQAADVLASEDRAAWMVRRIDVVIEE
jgi:hypothetical protein